MKRLLFLVSLFVSTLSLLQAQDVTKLTADTKTFLFSDGVSTVKNYIYNRLEAQTACCGSDRIYLEVKLDPSGYVLSVKALTGKNECFKESVIDIVKNIKWDASDFKGTKSIYFEVKPEINNCDNRNNQYVKIETFNNKMLDKSGMPINYAASSNVPSTQPAVTPPVVAPQPTQPAVTQPAQPVVAQPTQPVVAPQTTQPAVTQPVAQPSQPVVTAPQPVTPPANIPVQMTATPVGEPRATVPTPQPAVAQPSMPVPSAPVAPATAKAGPAPVDPVKVKETAEEVAALRAEMEKRMKVEEPVETPPQNEPAKPAAPAEPKKTATKPGDKKGKTGDDIWGMETGDADAKEEKGDKKQDCKPVVGKDGKPLLTKEGKPVLDCKPVVVATKLTPEEEKKKAEEEAKLKAEAAEMSKVASMSPEDRRRYEEEKRRKAEDDRIREEERKEQERIADIERKVKAAEDARRKAEEDAKRQEIEIQRAKDDLARAKVDAQRRKDDVELKRIEDERRALEERKKEQDRELQKIMDEIKRKQGDLERMTLDLQKQTELIRSVDEKKTKFQQEVALRNATGGGVSGVVVEPSAPATSSPATPAPAMKKEMKAEGDTAAVNLLMKQIELLRSQINIMQQEMDVMRTNRGVMPSVPSAPYKPSTVAPMPQVQPVPKAPNGATLTPNAPRIVSEPQNAATNRSWEKIDNNDQQPFAKTQQGQTIIMNEVGKNPAPAKTAPAKVAPAPAKTAPAQRTIEPAKAPVYVPAPTTVNSPAAQAGNTYVSTGDKNPEAAHIDTYKNIPMQEVSAPEFIEGEAGMRTYLRDKLRAAGYCGGVHVLSEVNVDRNGNVSSYKILKTVPEDVAVKLPSVLLGMKFKTNPSTAPFTQSVYIEFKGDIRCEGKTPEKTPVNQIPDFIK